MIMDNDSLGDRMKQYERVSNHLLVRKMPVIIRVDGRAFHTLTKSFEKPFDDRLMTAMDQTMIAMSKEIQGFKVAYTQSDEISFCMTDYDTISTDDWFGYKLSKIISITASMTTAIFNSLIKSKKLATFDCRAFNIPISDVSNYFLWRAKDWKRNSLQMYARSFFSHKDLREKNQAAIHEMLHKIDKNWATDLSPRKKNGAFLFNIPNDGYWIKNIEPTYANISEQIEPLINFEEGK